MTCDCCIELDTLQTIMDDGNDYYPENTDIVDTIFTMAGQTYTNATVMKQALWWKYRDYCIGACNTPKWVRGMADRLLFVGSKWDEIISKAYALDTDLSSITDRSYERIVKREPITGTQGDVNTLSHTGYDTHTMEHESMPQTASGTTKYLDARQTNTDTPGVTDTNTYTPNTQDTETYNADDTITAITFSDMMNNYPNVLLKYVDEFAEFFINRWY